MTLVLRSGSALTIFVLISVLAGAANKHATGSVAEPRTAPQATTPLIRQALSWLPADTETVTAANGPFPLPKLGDGDDDKKFESDEDIAVLFRTLALGLFEFYEGLFEKHFKSAGIELAIEGARHFRPPTGLGGGPYAGADILIFSSDQTEGANSFLKAAPQFALRMEQVDGESVAVFQEKMEEDTWTTYVAFPKPNIAVAASDRSYLGETLARIRGKSGPRALPDDLAEWKYVDTHAGFWAVRHYDPRGAATDPTSPFGGEKPANIVDERAVGLTVSVDLRKPRTVKLTYLGGKNAIEEMYSEVNREPGAKGLRPEYRMIEPGVFEGQYHLPSDDSVSIFVFVLIAMLGHAVYV
jgi:hypothetical protein